MLARSALFSVLLGLVAFSAPRAQGPAPSARLVSADGDRLVYEVGVTWPTPLAEAAQAASLQELVMQAAGGYTETSAALALRSLQAPQVEVLSSDFEEVAIPAGVRFAAEPDEPPARVALATILADRPAAVVGVGMERRRPAATLALRTLQYDAERGVLRRYTRLRVRVTGARPAPDEAGPLGSLQAGALAPGSSPHVAVTQSALAEGRWLRFRVRRSGAYRLDAAVLSELEIDPATIDPAAVRVYTNGGAALPALNSAPRPADLVETPSLVTGGGDGRFDSGDAVTFYAEGPLTWHWRETQEGSGTYEWQHELNVFTETTAVFVRLDAPTAGAARIQDATYPGYPDAQRQTSYLARIAVENEQYLFESDGASSGLDWLGTELTNSRPQTTVVDTTLAGRIGGPVQFRIRAAARSNPGASLAYSTPAGALATLRPNAVSFSTATGRLVAPVVERTTQSVPAGTPLRVALQLSGPASARAWTDWVEILAPRRLQGQGGALRFHTPGGQAGRFEYALAGFDGAPEVWDVTEPGSVRRLGVRASGSDYLVQIETADPNAPRELIAFVAQGVQALQPATAADVPNQNLHGVAGFPDYVIVTHRDFRGQAERLARHRQQNDGLAPLVVDIDEVYNEFSGGNVDMRAIRDFMKFLYDRAPDAARLPRYLLLFGDGHYDFRGLTTETPNFVPTFQSEETFYGDASYTSDDYFGLLDDDEGVWDYALGSGFAIVSNERVDIGIGRFPVRTASEGAVIIDKILGYESPATRGAWRTRVTLVADDQYPNPSDTDLHVQNAEAVASLLSGQFPAYNVRKIYPISYPEQQTAEGRRRPEAQRDLLRSFEEGTLVWSYAGHGNSRKLTDENLLTLEDIPGLRNYDRLPIFITATCTFGRFDKTTEQSGAEALLLSPVGGSVGLFTTVRLVFTSRSTTTLNVGLTLRLTENLLAYDSQGRARRLGDVMRETKNTSAGAQGNSRKFVLLGDPAMRVGLPERPVAITAINGVPITPALAAQASGTRAEGVLRGPEAPAPAASQSVPQLRALTRATIAGEVQTASGQRDTGFDGEVDVTVFDAAREVEMPPVAIQIDSYTVRSEVVYRGRASVRAGRWSLEFIVPQDVSYSGLPGRVSAYVVGTSGSASGTDGAGYTEGFVISDQPGGSLSDTEGPQISVFVGDSTFVDGGSVPDESLLIVTLRDASGINATGAGVGHDLLLVIDGDEAGAIDIGEFYQGDLDSFQSGTVRYRLPDLEPGTHTLRVRAWDVANNSSTAEVTFVVEPDADLELENVYPYPNPTSGRSQFAFEHNQAPGTAATAQVRIFTVAGRPVRTLDGADTLPTGTLDGPLVMIPWDGLDEEGDPLASGVYLVRVRVDVTRADGQRQSADTVTRLAVIR